MLQFAPDLIRRANAALREPRSAAVVFWTGGTLAVLSAIPLEHLRGQVDAALVAMVPVAAIAIGTLLWTGERPPGWLLHATTGLATVTITAVAAVAPDSGFSLLYIFVAIYAALFYSAKGLLAHLAAIAVAVGVAVKLQSPIGSPVVVWAAIVGTSTLASVTIRSLVVELRQLSKQDPLTQLANRRAWEEHLATEMVRAKRTGLGLGVAVLDLDSFKQVNDTTGHEAGDRLLQTLALSWRPVMRQSGDLLARLGGDEFGVVAVGTSLGGIERVVDRLRAAAASVDVAFACGVAVWDGVESVDHLVKRADDAMFREKAAHHRPDHAPAVGRM